MCQSKAGSSVPELALTRTAETSTGGLSPTDRARVRSFAATSSAVSVRAMVLVLLTLLGRGAALFVRRRGLFAACRPWDRRKEKATFFRK